MDDLRELLELTAAIASDFYETLPDRPVYPRATVAELHAAISAPLPEHGLPARTVIAELAAAVDPGLVAEASGRYFGFVVGGAVPASIAADWLTSTWDQNAGLFVLGPSASIVEQAAGAWLIELLGLPRHASFGFVTGAQMANFTALAAARHHVLARAGWDVEHDGLQGAPKIRVVVGAKRHGTIDRALRMLGLGAPSTSRGMPGMHHGARPKVSQLPVRLWPWIEPLRSSRNVQLASETTLPTRLAGTGERSSKSIRASPSVQVSSMVPLTSREHAQAPGCLRSIATAVVRAAAQANEVAST
jgi:hypothetical protein